MKTVTHEYMKKLRNGNNAFATIVNTPRPDFTELDKQCKEFEEWSLKEQPKDRIKIQKALKEK